MARRIVHQLVDDIDGSVLEVGEGETIHFSLNGQAWEVDLNEAHARELREALEPYISAGRRAGSGGAPRSSSFFFSFASLLNSNMNNINKISSFKIQAKNKPLEGSFFVCRNSLILAKERQR